MFAPDGRTLATGGDSGTVVLWDLTGPAPPHQLGSPLTGHTGLVNSMAFTPDGRTLATGGFDDTVILWDLTDRTQPRRLGVPLTGHTELVTSVAFTPDGRTLATGSIDTTLWDVTTPNSPRRLGPLLPSNPLSGHPQARSVAFSSDGRTLAIGISNGTVVLWDLADLNQVRDHAVQRACAITHGGLDRDEWDRRIPDLPYQDSCPPDGG